MSRHSELILAEEFEVPAIRSRLEALLILASSIGAHLEDIFRATEIDKSRTEWHVIIDILARAFSGQIRTVTEPNEARLIWNQFANSTTVAKLGRRVKEILGQVEEELNMLLANPANAVNYLLEANRNAAASVLQLAKRRKLKLSKDIQPIPIAIYFDPEGKLFCTSSAPVAGRIIWNLQLQEHAFRGALIANWIFEHEYLSHLLPRNRYLSGKVREVWLNAALLQDHNDCAHNRVDNNINQFLFWRLRWDLANHSGGFFGDLFEISPINVLAIKIHFRAPEVFWQLTSEILNLEDSRENAVLVDDLLQGLAHLSDAQLKELVMAAWDGQIESMYLKINNVRH